MADIQFQCPQCGGNLEVEDAGAGQEIPCPICQQSIIIPKPTGQSTTPAATTSSGRGFRWAALAGILALAAIIVYGLLLHLKAEQRGPDISQLRSKAEKGEANAQYSLGVCYAEGKDVVKNEIEAASWFRKAAEQGNANAQYSLGGCYAEGKGVAKNQVEAMNWVRKAAEHGNANAQYCLGVSYYTNRVTSDQKTEGVKWFRNAAEQGNAQAQEMLGQCYSEGWGVTKDKAEAFKWYNKAAQQGDATAQHMLGWMYATGDGVPKDEAEAVKCFGKAANGDDEIEAQAYIMVASSFAAKDGATAIRWYLMAAEKGEGYGFTSIAEMYHIGNGVPKDMAEAFKWYHKAAEAGDAEAQNILGDFYNLGRDVKVDYVEAAKWYRKAAEQEHWMAWSAQLSLSILYQFGNDVPEDYVEAYKWCSLAVAHNASGDAYGLLAKLEKKMTPEQIAEGQRLAREFKPRKARASRAPASGRDVFSSSPAASGTGFFITEDGFLISNAHVVQGAAEVRLVVAAGPVSARVVKVDAANDLALLKAEGRFAPLPIATSRGVKLGGTVATVGFPNIGLQGFAPKLAKGEIAALSGAQDDARYFQISVPVQPGNSGGALVDERGNVVGVVSAKLSARVALATSGALPENVSYAVKSSFLLSFLESVPEVSAKLKEPNTRDRKFEDVVKSAEQAAVLVLVY